MRVWTKIAGALALLACPIAAQETRVAPESHTPPPATLEQMVWLVGQWVGTGIGGAPAMESWLPPSGDTMVGTFLQESGEGGIRFSEHMYLMEEEGTLVLRLKHFNADLTGWEEKDGMLTFSLIAVEDCAAYFRSLTLRCNGGDGLLAAVRMKSAGDEVKELIFRFERRADPSQPDRCSDAVATPELARCFGDVLRRSDQRRQEYLAAALEKHAEDPEIPQSISASEAAFEGYRDAECAAIRESFRGGSIAGFEVASCRIALSDARTLVIWQNWLTYWDGSPAKLPKPLLTP